MNGKVFENIQLCHDLKEMVLNFQSRHPRLSLPQVAKRISVSYPTLNRVMNNTGRPSVSVVANILVHTGHGDQLENFLRRVEPQLVDALELKSEALRSDDGVSECFAKKEYILILLQAYTKVGTTRGEIAKHYGREGVNRLEELLEKNLVIEKRGRIWGREEQATYAQRNLHKSLRALLENSDDPLLFGLDKNWLSLQTESVDKKKAAPIIRNLLQKAYREIKEILYSEEYAGRDVVFIGMAFDEINKRRPV